MFQNGTAPTPVDHWLDAAEDFIALVDRDDDALVGALAAHAGGAPPMTALIDRRAIAAAAVTADGRVVKADANFLAWFDPDAIDARIVARIPSVHAVEGGLVLDKQGRIALLAYVGNGRREGWFVPDDIRGVLSSGHASVAIVAVHASLSDAFRAEMARTFGLTPAEARLATSLVANGRLREAATDAGVAYETARDTLQSVLRKTGTASQAALIARLLRRSTGIWSADPARSASEMATLLGLTARQTAAMFAIARGIPRREAAARMGVSEAVLKDELARVFATLGVEGAPDLARFVADALALVALLISPKGDLVIGPPGGEATRYCARPDGSAIAFTDHGPADGTPVLLLHGAGTTRHAARTLVHALLQKGLRPVAIDRPGFGQTEMVESADPFVAAANDMLRVCAMLRIDRVRVLSRGSAAAALAIARAAGDRVVRVVVINPDVPVAHDTHGTGLLAATKRALYRHPGALQWIARLLAGSASEALTAKSLRRNLASSPPDLALFEDPSQVADYHRSTRLMATGAIQGYLAEHSAYRAGWMPEPLADASHWTVLHGRHDPLFDWRESAAFWTRMLPGATFRDFADGGRFLHITHAQIVAEALAR